MPQLERLKVPLTPPPLPPWGAPGAPSPRNCVLPWSHDCSFQVLALPLFLGLQLLWRAKHCYMFDNCINWETVILRNWIDKSVPTGCSIIYSPVFIHLVHFAQSPCSIPYYNWQMSSLGEGDIWHCGASNIHSSVRTPREKRNSFHNGIYCTIGQTSGPGNRRKGNASLLVDYVNVSEPLKWSETENYKIITYLYQINTVDHQNHQEKILLGSTLDLLKQNFGGEDVNRWILIIIWGWESLP